VGFETKWDIVVVGGANWDYLVVLHCPHREDRDIGVQRRGEGEQLVACGTVRGDDFQEAPGGKSTNQAARACRALELASFRVEA
jgi:sugar/nucleoside kinase (ribokinase family)